MSNYQNIPDLTGKVAIVTGANSGTGYGITYHLAKHGCKVVMASRNASKLMAAQEQMRGEVPGADLEIEVVDVSDLRSIQKFTDTIKGRYDKIDFLANNAGGGGPNFVRTADGLEANMAVNYFGHFALTVQLLPTLKDGSRIVTFSSMGYKRFLRNDLDVDNLMLTSANGYNQMQEYCKAKLCAILFGVKLQREFEAMGSTSLALSCHPGYARTNLMNKADTPAMMRVVGKVMNGASGLLGLSHDLYDGALPAIEALVTSNPQPNMVYAPSKRGEATGPPVAMEIDRSRFTEADIDALWEKTQELLDIKVSEYL